MPLRGAHFDERREATIQVSGVKRNQPLSGVLSRLRPSKWNVEGMRGFPKLNLRRDWTSR
jgi:hypothetical protein